VPLSVIKRSSTLLLIVAPLTSLAISPWFNFDPINLIKIVVLTSFTMMSFGLLVPYWKQFLSGVGAPTVVAVSGFFVSLMSALLFNDTDKAQQFWGIFGRGTGLLSYAVLALLFTLSNFLASSDFNSKVVISLLITAAIMVLYCFIQIIGRDPIQWSAFFPFGTLGNVNFLSGFMGVALVSVLIVSFSPALSGFRRLSVGFLAVAGLFVLYKSNSTQGLVALAVGVATFLLIKSIWVGRLSFFAAATIYSLGIMSLVAGLFNKGPFREFIYQFTVTFRADYMHAGIEMLLRNPLNGVGLDAYDDWYRAERGVVSAFRTSLNRTANSAHNITLDLGASGGFPLLTTYIGLVILVLVHLIVGLRRGMHEDHYFMAAAMSWVAYQVQAAVSINQIGVGVWGWILGGLIVGRVRRFKVALESDTPKIKRLSIAKKGPNTPPPLAVICSLLTLALGLLMSIPPLKTDADYLQATKTGNAGLFLEVSTRPSANAFLLSRSASSLNSGGLKNETKQVIDTLTRRFPRNIFARTVQLESFSETAESRIKAIGAIREIDPILGLCYESNPSAKIRSLLEGIPSSQKYDLARGWGLLPTGTKFANGGLDWSMVDQSSLTSKISSFCLTP